MVNLFKSKVFVVFLATIVLFTLMAVSANLDTRVNWLDNVVNVPLSPLQKFLAIAEEKGGEVSFFFKDVKAVRQENEALKKQIDLLENEKRELEAFRDENKNLREALNLKEQLNEYDSLGANIIAKDAGNWFSVFTIDRGTKDGITSGLAVITSKGLVGMVTNAGSFTSKVIAIIDPDSTVSTRISKTGVDSVIVKGDLSLKDMRLCRMDRIPPDADISVGDSLETSGLGGVFPKGIAIGKIKEIRKTNSELSRYAIISPSVDFKKLDEVFVLKPRSNTTETGSVAS